MRRNWLIPFFYLASAATVVVLYVTVYGGALPGGSYDASRFYYEAGNWVDNGQTELVFDSYFFIQWVGIYRLMGANYLVSTLIGVALIFLVSFYYLRRVYLLPVVLAYVWLVFLSPSSLFRFGVMLREHYVIFFMSLSLYFGCKMVQQHKFIPRYFLAFIFFFGAAAMFHKAVLVLFPFAVLLFFAFLYEIRLKSFGQYALIGFVLLVLFSQLVPMLPSGRGTQVLISLFAGDFDVLLSLSDSKAWRHDDAGATYYFSYNYSSIPGIIMTMLNANLYYYLYPFPWELRGIPDSLIFLENWLRVILLFIIVRRVIRSGNPSVGYFVLAIYFSLNMIWAMGTFNFGTGSRHHWSSIFVLLPIFYYYYSNTFRVTKND